MHLIIIIIKHFFTNWLINFWNTCSIKTATTANYRPSVWTALCSLDSPACYPALSTPLHNAYLNVTALINVHPSYTLHSTNQLFISTVLPIKFGKSTLLFKVSAVTFMLPVMSSGCVPDVWCCCAAVLGKPNSHSKNVSRLWLSDLNCEAACAASVSHCANCRSEYLVITPLCTHLTNVSIIRPHRSTT